MRERGGGGGGGWTDVNAVTDGQLKSLTSKIVAHPLQTLKQEVLIGCSGSGCVHTYHSSQYTAVTFSIKYRLLLSVVRKEESYVNLVKKKKQEQTI